MDNVRILTNIDVVRLPNSVLSFMLSSIPPQGISMLFAQNLQLIYMLSAP